ncbi:hypothetical protein CBO47_12995 [Bordetella pertussis]|nr:hypothetical protein WU39_13035 [Bordetella pertussis]AQW65333.1 hypothetical protein B2G54_13135 [Bordetella pertussis]ASR59282.1 hypothetical protein CBO47_12995 [Bordetella pertussis]ASR62867.1 hypothetical protein CBO46_12655 [Bordetella pertussis]AUR78355.1 hypothetical protein BBB35_13340 [Bordetella pertussis]
MASSARILSIANDEKTATYSMLPPSCEDSIGCMHGSSEPDLRNWKSPTSQFTQGARPDEHP